MGETEEKITDIDIISKTLSEKLSELNPDYELKEIVLCTLNSYKSKKITLEL